MVGGPQVSAISQWRPGAACVTWAGTDGHYFSPAGTFPQLFGAAIAQIRRITSPGS